MARSPGPLPFRPSRARLAAILGTIAAAACPLAAPGQPAEPPPASRPAAPAHPLDITGEDFAGVRLPSVATPGVIDLAGSRVSSWTVSATPYPVHRLFLSGDVRVRLGVYEFSAAQAAVWIQRLDADPAPETAGVYQVFAYLDRAGSPTAAAGLAFAGDRLAVQGVIAVTEPIALAADLRLDHPPDDEPFLEESERQLATYLRRLVFGEAWGPEPGLEPEPGAMRAWRRGPIEPGVSRPPEPAEDPEFIQRVRELEQRHAAAARPEPIFARTGVFAISPGGQITSVREGDGHAVMATGGVVVQYWDRQTDRTLQMSAERAVVFLDRRADGASTSFDASDVRGVYLEGDVQADAETREGDYHVRAPVVYYDVRHDRALMLDAVFWTYDARRGMPLYVRAEAIRQESSNQYTARGARLSNTAFAEPHLSIGASSVTITRVPEPAGDGSRTIADARNITLRAGPFPFFYWPWYRGDPSRFPLRAVSFENSSGFGPGVRTAWDLWSLLGIDGPDGLRANLLAEWYTRRGFAGGVEADWVDERSEGGLIVYGVPNDRGTDRLSGGARVERDGEFRGMVLAEHRAELDERWALFAEVAQISDENFVDAYFGAMSRARREFTNALTLHRTGDRSVLQATAEKRFHDFIANEHLLQSPGFTVDRLPEISYARFADDLLDQTAPGALTWFSEYRLGQLAMNFHEPTARETGFDRRARALAALGVDLDDSVAERLEAIGLEESSVLRFDTRHELVAPLTAGPIELTPFAIGRATAYDQDFDDFSADADEPYRLWGAVGATASTEIQKIDNGVESRLFDLHRIRHLIEPSVTVWWGETTIGGEDLPPYDPGVEELADGLATRFGIDQTWQTQRGGPGRWRSIDVFTLSTGLVLSADEAAESPIGRFIGYRPEYSSLGDFATLEGTWLVTEALALSGSTVYDLDLNQAARTSAGLLLQHDPDFSTFAEMRYINPEDSTVVLFGAAYQLTPKYALRATGTYDADADNFQAFRAELRRRFPSVELGVSAGYNNITSESSFGVTIAPIGVDESAARVRDLGGARRELRGSPGSLR